MPIAPGYFLTWHTYGTWLHGDSAGSVDRMNNKFDSPRLKADSDRFDHTLNRLSPEPFVLTPIAQAIVSKVMRDHCTIRN